MPLPPAHAPPPLSGSRSPSLSPPFAYFLLSPSSSPSLAPLPFRRLSFSRMIPPFTAFSNRFLSLPFAGPSSVVFSLFLPLGHHRITARGSTRVGRSINQLIQIISSTRETRPIRTLVCPSTRIRYWILLATFFDLTLAFVRSAYSKSACHIESYHPISFVETSLTLWPRMACQRDVESVRNDGFTRLRGFTRLLFFSSFLDFMLN